MSDFEDSTAQVTRELLHQLSAKAPGRCYLLRDPLIRRVEGLPQISVRLAHRNVDPANCPVLTPLNIDVEADRALLVSTVREARTELAPDELRAGKARRICGWIVSDASVEIVADHLGRIMVQRYASAEHHVWLRLHDPAVLWLVWSWLRPEQQATVLGPIGSFHLLDPAGQLQTLRAEVPASTSSLDLSAGQWVAIDCIEPLNIALRDWGGLWNRPDKLHAARTHAFAAIRRAKALGFADSNDLALYAHYALWAHPRFDFHALVTRCLRARQPGDYFSALIAGLSAEDWARVAKEAPPLETA